MEATMEELVEMVDKRKAMKKRRLISESFSLLCPGTIVTRK